MLANALLAAALAAPTQAAEGEPLLDLTLQGLAGGGYAVSRGDGADIMGRYGAALTGWVHPRVGLGVRLDRGTYGLIDDEGNAFAFAEARYRLPARDLALGAGVGTPVIWVEYFCDVNNGPCREGPWEYHDPIGTVSATWEKGLGPFHLPLALRLEASKVRVGLGVDVGFGWRFRRR